MLLRDDYVTVNTVSDDERPSHEAITQVRSISAYSAGPGGPARSWMRGGVGFVCVWGWGAAFEGALHMQQVREVYQRYCSALGGFSVHVVHTVLCQLLRMHASTANMTTPLTCNLAVCVCLVCCCVTCRSTC